jgi:hypothetical protein
MSASAGRPVVSFDYSALEVRVYADLVRICRSNRNPDPMLLAALRGYGLSTQQALALHAQVWESAKKNKP